jgi:glycosyltransferase involved in cell wall biosynthesis
MTVITTACVIPTHRRDHLLQRAIESVRQQTLPPDLIIVVDDIGSATTRQLLEQRRDVPNLVYVDNSAGKFKGASSSRNAGVAAAPANTEILAFLDDDDKWAPTFLEACLSRLKKADADLVAAWGSLEVNGEAFPRGFSMRCGLSAPQCLSRNPGITGSNFVIRRAAFDAIGGFDSQLPVYNDLDFFVRFLEANMRYAVVEERLVIQSVDGSDHLSSRGLRRARGIESYIAKHQCKLTTVQLRHLQRDRHLAQRYPGQTLHRRLYHFLMMWAKSSPEQLANVLRSRSQRRGRMYG